MIRVTILALVIALCNAKESIGASRLLLQAAPGTTAAPAQTAIANPGGNPAGVPPVAPPNPAGVNPGAPPVTAGPPPASQPPFHGHPHYGQPPQPAYNPYAPPASAPPAYNQYQQPQGPNMNNPYCNPMSGMYDMQDCIQYGGYMNQQHQPNMNNPYCNPMSPVYDVQDCFQYGGGYAYQPQQQSPYGGYMNQYQPPSPAVPAPAVRPPATGYNPYQPQGAAPAPATRPGQVNPMNNPYCDPYDRLGMYDPHDCQMSTMYGFHAV